MVGLILNFVRSKKKNGVRIYDSYAIIIPNRNWHITKLETIMKESSKRRNLNTSKNLASCQNDLKRTCSVINNIIGKKTSTSPNCLKHNDKLLTDSIEIAELFNDHFSSIASKLRAKLHSSPNPTNLNSKILLKVPLLFFHAYNCL